MVSDCRQKRLCSEEVVDAQRMMASNIRHHSTESGESVQSQFGGLGSTATESLVVTSNFFLSGSGALDCAGINDFERDGHPGTDAVRGRGLDAESNEEFDSRALLTLSREHLEDEMFEDDVSVYSMGSISDEFGCDLWQAQDVQFSHCSAWHVHLTPLATPEARSSDPLLAAGTQCSAVADCAAPLERAELWQTCCSSPPIPSEFAQLSVGEVLQESEGSSEQVVSPRLDDSKVTAPKRLASAFPPSSPPPRNHASRPVPHSRVHRQWAKHEAASGSTDQSRIAITPSTPGLLVAASNGRPGRPYVRSKPGFASSSVVPPSTTAFSESPTRLALPAPPPLQRPVPFLHRASKEASYRMDMFDDRVRVPAVISVRSSSLVRGCQALGANTSSVEEDGGLVSERSQAIHTGSTPRGLEDKQQAHQAHAIGLGLMSNARASALQMASPSKSSPLHSKLSVGEATPWLRCASASKPDQPSALELDLGVSAPGSLAPRAQRSPRAASVSAGFLPPLTTPAMSADMIACAVRLRASSSPRGIRMF